MQPAKTSVSPRSSPLGTFRAEERGRFSVRNVPNGEERGETDIFTGYSQCFKCVLMLTLKPLWIVFTHVISSYANFLKQQKVFR